MSTRFTANGLVHEHSDDCSHSLDAQKGWPHLTTELHYDDLSLIVDDVLRAPSKVHAVGAIVRGLQRALGLE